MALGRDLYSLTKEDVNNYASEVILKKGLESYQLGTLMNQVVAANTLSARIMGSYGLYTMKVKISEGVIASCNCPFNGLVCKHVIALLFNWLEKPDDFTDAVEIRQKINSMSIDQMRSLIELLAPDNWTLIAEFTGSGKHRHAGKNVKPLAVQLEWELDNLFDGEFVGRKQRPRFTRQMERMVKGVKLLVELHEWDEALAVGFRLLKEGVGFYHLIDDCDGAYWSCLESCIFELKRIFANCDIDQADRELYLEKLFELFKSSDNGAASLLVPFMVTMAEQEDLAIWLKELMQEQLREGNLFEDARDRVVELLALLLENRGDQENALAVMRDHLDGGYAYQRLIRKLASWQRPAEAMHYAEEGLSRLVGHEQIALRRLLAELKEAAGDLESALGLQLTNFQNSPSLDTYQTIKNLATRMNRWPFLYLQLMQDLQEKGRWNVLIDIYTADQELPLAIEVARNHRVNMEDLERVGNLAENDLPLESVDIYQRLVQLHVKRKNRNDYRRAAELMYRIREIYRRLEDKLSWQTYIGSVKDEHQRKKAFLDEIKNLA